MNRADRRAAKKRILSRTPPQISRDELFRLRHNPEAVDAQHAQWAGEASGIRRSKQKGGNKADPPGSPHAGTF